MNTPENREQIAEIMFETFNVKGLFIGVQASLALYAQVCKTDQPEDQNQQSNGLSDGDMTGTVIDAGDGVTHIFPVCDSYVIGSCVKNIPLAGRDMTNFVLQSLKDRGEKWPAADSNEIAARIKEKYGYVCSDVQKEYAKFDKKKIVDGKAVQSSKFKKFVHKTLNNNMVSIDVGYESFLAPEMFFHPEFVHKDYIKPIEEVVDDAIQSCPVEYRIKLYNNIVLSGGSTLFKGFDERLQKNL
jgi:actin-related protein 3